MPTIDFTASPSARRVEGDFAIYPDSKIFHVGDYPDKKFSMTAEEMARVPMDFSPVFGNIEHTDFLKGRACRVNSVRVEGDELRGEIAVPLSLDGLMEPGERKLSAEWDRQSKRLVGVALTVTPRVLDAALMSSLNPDAHFKHNTPQGQMAMQDLHDAACRYGAVCDKSNTADMASRHEATAIQSMHDTAVDHGAKCASGDKPSYFSDPSPTTPERPATPQGANKPMTLIDKLRAAFSASGVPEDKMPAFTEADFSTPDPAAAAKIAALESQVAQFAQRDADARKEARAREAAAFADGEVAECRAFPAERESLSALFTQAAQDDEAAPAVVTFSAGGETVTGSRVEALRAALAARPRHRLMGEAAAAPGQGVAATVEFTAAGTPAVTRGQDADGKRPEGPVSAARRQELLGMSPTGRAILKEETK